MLDSYPPASLRSEPNHILAEADYIIEIGPVGGSQDGELLYQAAPGLLKQKTSPTAPYLKANLNR